MSRLCVDKRFSYVNAPANKAQIEPMRAICDANLQKIFGFDRALTEENAEFTRKQIELKIPNGY